MKHLLLIRHAKSSWENFSVKDFDRPLNDRGKRDAPEMAKRLVEKGIKIDAFISSPAKRAKKTATYFVEAYAQSVEAIVFKEELYLATPAVFFNVICNLSTSADTVAIFSHNEGITDFANQLTNARIDNFPTCGIFGVKVHTNSWWEFKAAEKEFWFFNYPKAVAGE